MNGPARRPAAGQRIAGRWEVTGELVGSDLYDAYLVVDGQGVLGRIVLFPQETATRSDVWTHCIESARIAATPPTPEIPAVLDAGTDPDLACPYLVTEHAPWPSLAEHVDTSGPLSPRNWAAALGALAPALDAAHRRGVVHRGLQPRALLLSLDNFSDVKILDFGLGVVRAALPPPPGWAGPPGWVGPDGADPAVRPTPATDVYALGLISFFALTARPAFRSLERVPLDYDLLWREMIEPLGVISRLAQDLGATLDASLDDWFARALAPQPRARFGSATALARAFGEIVRRDLGEPEETVAVVRRERRKTLVGPGPAPGAPGRAVAVPPPLPAERQRPPPLPESAPRAPTPVPETPADVRPGIVTVSVQPLAFAKLPARAPVAESPPVETPAAVAAPPPPQAPAPPPQPTPVVSSVAPPTRAPAELVSAPGRPPMPTVPELDEPPLAVTGAQRGPNLWLIVLLLLACFGIGGGIAAWFWLRARAPIASEPDAAASVPVAVSAADAAPVLAADAAPAIAADAAPELPPVVSTALTDALAPVADAATDAASPDAASPDAALDALAAEPAKKPAAEKPAPRPQRAPKAKPRPPKSAEPCGTFINPCK